MKVETPNICTAILLVVLFVSLSLARADQTLSGTQVFNYNIGGATGTVRIIRDVASPYVLADPLIVPPPGTVLFFNLTGKITALPSNQFQFQAWNTSNTGIIPITIETGTVSPTYMLNAQSYSYSSPNIVSYTQLANKTVTLYFGNITGDTANLGLKIIQAQTIETVPSYSSSNYQLSFRVSTSTIGNVLVASPVLSGPESVAVGGNLTFYSAGHWTWDNTAKRLTIPIPIGAYDVLITWQAPSTSTGGGGTTPTPTPSHGLFPKVVLPGSILIKPMLSFFPNALVSMNVAIENPNPTPHVVAGQYTVTNLANGNTVYQDSFNVTALEGSTTYTLQAIVPSTGHYRLDVQPLDKAITGGQQDFDVDTWDAWEGPIILWGIVASVVIVGSILIIRRWQQ
jgi:hypothetical protein